ncbi:MAG TPA: WhiB family transcriptional regulator [Candidatus Saccharimonadales bacterium]|jgi:hypothetical protein
MSLAEAPEIQIEPSPLHLEEVAAPVGSALPLAAEEQPDQRKELFAYITVKGRKPPEVMNVFMAKSVLRELAGTDELNRPSVLKRFKEVNDFILTGQPLGQTKVTKKVDKDGNRRERAGFSHPEAKCRYVDPALFYPEQKETEKREAAIAVCADCAAREACLNYAVYNNEARGIWGGATERQRKKIRIGLGLSDAKP